MRSYPSRNLTKGFVALAAPLAVLVMVATGCEQALGLQDWQRDFLGLFSPPIIIPLPTAGSAGPAGPAGPAGGAGPAGAPGAPGPNSILARAVVNSDGTLQDSDGITAAHPFVGNYQLTVDLTGDTLPAGITEDDFEVLVTLKDVPAGQQLVANYIPISLVGTTLTVNVVIVTNGGGSMDSAFSVQVMLPGG